MLQTTADVLSGLDEGATMARVKTKNLVPALYLMEKQRRERDAHARGDRDYKYTYTEIADEANILYSAVLRYVKDQTTRADFDLLGDWCDYFGVRYVLVREDVLPEDFDALIEEDSEAVLRGLPGLFIQ